MAIFKILCIINFMGNQKELFENLNRSKAPCVMCVQKQSDILLLKTENKKLKNQIDHLLDLEAMYKTFTR